MANNHSDIERRLWGSADELRANSKLKSSEYSVPVLGLIFLRYADHKFSLAEKQLAGKGSGRRGISKEDYQAKGVMFLPPQARFSHLLALPEGENIGKAINDAMKAVESENEELKGVLPKSYNKIENSTLVSLLKENPTVAIELMAHTDCRGNEADNLVLSQKRAQSVVDYLISKGIQQERLMAKGYGERVPKIADARMLKGNPFLKKGQVLNCQFIEGLKKEEEREACHQFNRRTEFKVTSSEYREKFKE